MVCKHSFSATRCPEQYGHQGQTQTVDSWPRRSRKCLHHYSLVIETKHIYRLSGFSSNTPTAPTSSSGISIDEIQLSCPCPSLCRRLRWEKVLVLLAATAWRRIDCRNRIPVAAEIRGTSLITFARGCSALYCSSSVFVGKGFHGPLLHNKTKLPQTNGDTLTLSFIQMGKVKKLFCFLLRH